MKESILILIFILTSGYLVFGQQTPAFPTAEGYGKYAKGGRGGKVVFVENLEDYIAYNNLETPIPGSFRWALTQYPGEPLTIIFRVSGTIKLKPHIISGKNQNDIRSSRANLTIAGQSAPGEGICIRNSKVNLGGSTDLIVRNVRFRIGENAADSTFIPGGSVGCENATRVIFDHCVFGWSGEENITMYDNRFSTVQWSVMHEGLYDDGHGKGNRSYGGQCGGVNATWHHNLFAHNYSRSPRLNGARTDNETRVFIEFINNVNYNWGRSGAPYGGDIIAGTLRSHTANFVSNYYKPGPGTDASRVFFNASTTSGANFPKWYVNGNVMEGSPDKSSNNWSAFSVSYAIGTQSDIKSDTMLLPPVNLINNGNWITYEPYKINIQSAEEAYQDVVKKAGTVNRDSVERRIIKEVKTGTSQFKASQGKWGIIDKSYNAEGYLNYPTSVAPADNDRDGMADEWEIQNFLNPNNPEDRNELTPEGYTALEVYLNNLMGENIVHQFSTDNKQIKAQNIHLYPDITGNSINISSPFPVRSVSVFNQNGQKVMSVKSIDSNKLDITKLQNGVYVLQILTQSGENQNFKIIKEN